MRKKVLVSVGGTGGHIYPAVALAQTLCQQEPSLELLFVGGHLSNNRFFQNFSFDYRNISCASLSFKKPFTSFLNLHKIWAGIKESQAIFRRFCPDLMIGFGSYHTLPTMIAAKLEGIPYFLHASDTIPGKVIRLFSRYAIATSIHFPETESWLQGRCIQVKMPLRDGYKFGYSSKEEARRYFNLEQNKVTLLAFGGSQGASSLNRVIESTLTTYFRNIQIIHLTGHQETTLKLQKKYTQMGLKAYVADFEPRMDLAWQAADVAISRAGALTLAEQIEFEVPGILVPYPHAADNHQEKNALSIAGKIGSVQMILESNLTPKTLGSSLDEFLEEENLERRRENFRSYKKNHTFTDLSTLLLEELYR